MNREIKFRAWHNSGQMLFGKNEAIFRWEYEGQPIEIMQYTGLKDKNGKGKNIYEADIFNNTNKTAIGIVSWYKDQWVVRFPTYQYSLYQFLENDETREVIGNIHENPELLK